MSLDMLIELCSAVCPWLAAMWCLQSLVRWTRLPVRDWTLLALTGALAAAVMLVPVQGFAIARWVATLNPNFSVPLSGMLAISVWERTFGRSVFSNREWTTAWSFGAIGGLVLYPMALGLGSVDPYEWGWRFGPLWVLVGMLTAWLVWQQNRFAVLLLLAAGAWHLRLLESTNYWDYLLDPVYSLVSLGWVVTRLSTRTSLTKRYSNTLPRSISTS